MTVSRARQQMPRPSRDAPFSSGPVRTCAAPALPCPALPASQICWSWAGFRCVRERYPARGKPYNRIPLRRNARQRTAFCSPRLLLVFKNNQKLCTNYMQCSHKHHMENDGTFSCLWGKLLCSWKYSVWLALTQCREDSGSANGCVCACLRVQQQPQVPLVASASSNTCNLLSKIPNEPKKPF